MRVFELESIDSFERYSTTSKSCAVLKVQYFEALVRESLFNMTRWGGGDEDIEGGLRKFLDTRRGGSEKIVALEGGAPKICILQNQHMTSSYRSDGFQLNNLMTCATQLYHVVYRYNKCSLSNYYTLVHPKNALENCITTVSQVCHSINH